MHSAKDLTGEMPEGLVIGAMPERGDPRDACCGPYASLEEMPAGARVGTSSARRAGLLGELRPDLQVVPLRGNVDTRLRKLDEGEADVIVLAAAGLRRLGLETGSPSASILTVFVPEAGQGALAVQVRAGEEERVAATEHAPSRARSWTPSGRASPQLGGGCTVPRGRATPGTRRGRLRVRILGGRMTVYLVGAGPGDPGLLTLRGRELSGALRCGGVRRAGRPPGGGDGAGCRRAHRRRQARGPPRA